VDVVEIVEVLYRIYQIVQVKLNKMVFNAMVEKYLAKCHSVLLILTNVTMTFSL
jgi:hypothetical protein